MTTTTITATNTGRLAVQEASAPDSLTFSWCQEWCDYQLVWQHGTRRLLFAMRSDGQKSWGQSFPLGESWELPTDTAEAARDVAFRFIEGDE